MLQYSKYPATVVPTVAHKLINYWEKVGETQRTVNAEEGMHSRAFPLSYGKGYGKGMWKGRSQGRR